MTTLPSLPAIDLWIDVVCPWCRLNHARLEKARATLAADGVYFDVVYRPFQLAPHQPPGVTRAEHFTRAFGDIRKADAAFEHVRRIGAAEGVEFRFDRIEFEPDTLNAHRLLRRAQQQGVADNAATQIYEAFFVNGQDIGDLDTLVSVGTRAGLDRESLAVYLSAGEDTAEVQQQADDAHRLGVRGVPTYGVNGRPTTFNPGSSDLPTALRELLRIARPPST